MDNANKIQTWRDANPTKRITEKILLDILGVESLQNAYLGEANLSGADLSGVNLQDANLWGADLRDADLTDATLTNAYLKNANLTNAYLTGADLRGANLKNANLRGADLWSADLRDANLTGTILTTVNLREANLRGADVRGADLRGTDLRGANLSYCTGGVTQIDNLYPYPATLQPTIDGWYARVGCWYGTLDELHEIASSDKDEDWPEATGAEREWRLPLLQAILSVFDAQVISHPDIITELNVNELNNRWGK